MVSGVVLGVFILMEMAWYVGVCLPGFSRTAAGSLEELGFGVYSPRVKNPETGAMEMLFPRYVLIFSVISPVAWAAANSAKGMKRLLPLHCEAPSRLPTYYVDDLRERVEMMDVASVHQKAAEREFSRGDRVTISNGEYFGDGTYEGKKKGCALVLLALLGAQRVVSVPFKDIAHSADAANIKTSKVRSLQFRAPSRQRSSANRTVVR